MAGSSRRTRASAVIAGIGDDCAVLRSEPGSEILVTTDFSLEGVHFRRDWHTPESVGHRCLARGLSDIAAMGGKPLAVFLSLALPKDLAQSWVRAVSAGADRTCWSIRRHVGRRGYGAVARRDPGGHHRRRRSAEGKSDSAGGRSAWGSDFRQWGARRVSCGGSAHGKRRGRIRGTTDGISILSRESNWVSSLRKKGLASAMIDTSDGLSTDLSHICEESGVGAEIEAMAIPRACVGRPRQEVDLDLAAARRRRLRIALYGSAWEKDSETNRRSEAVGSRKNHAAENSADPVRRRQGQQASPRWLAALRAVAPRAALTIRKEARAPKPE